MQVFPIRPNAAPLLAVVTAWVEDAALRLSVVQRMPTFGEAPSEETEILIGYTEEAVYIAAAATIAGRPQLKRGDTSAGSFIPRP